MDDAKEYGRKFPPRSKFNDQESTAVLRLIIEQEKLLKNATVTPLFNIPANRSQRLPPLNAKRSESLDENDLENVRTRKSSESGLQIFSNNPTLLKGKPDCRSVSDNGILPGKPSRVPDIYSTTPTAKHRDRERPKGSYGRHPVLRKEQSSDIMPCALENNALEQQNGTLVDNRPSNPLPGYSPETMSSCSNTSYLSDQEKQTCSEPSQRSYSPPSYIN